MVRNVAEAKDEHSIFSLIFSYKRFLESFDSKERCDVDHSLGVCASLRSSHRT